MLSLSMNLSQKLSMQQRLENSLRIHHRITLTMRLYLEQEEFVKGLVRQANEKNWWKYFNKDGFTFSYISVPKNKLCGLEKTVGWGFAHCFSKPWGNYSLGEWVLFVFEDLIPKGYEDLVAMHEWGEVLSLGDHFFASKLEFAYSKYKRKSGSYVAVIEEHHPIKFTDFAVTTKGLPRELLDELDEKPNEQIIAAHQLIDLVGVPVLALQKAHYYDALSEKLRTRLKNIIGPYQNKVFGITAATMSLENAKILLHQKLSAAIGIVPEHQRNAISRWRINEELEIIRKILQHDFYRHFRAPLHMVLTYDEALTLLKERKSLVKV